MPPMRRKAQRPARSWPHKRRAFTPSWSGCANWSAATAAPRRQGRSHDGRGTRRTRIRLLLWRRPACRAAAMGFHWMTTRVVSKGLPVNQTGELQQQIRDLALQLIVENRKRHGPIRLDARSGEDFRQRGSRTGRRGGPRPQHSPAPSGFGGVPSGIPRALLPAAARVTGSRRLWKRRHREFTPGRADCSGPGADVGLRGQAGSTWPTSKPRCSPWSGTPPTRRL